MNLFSFSRMLVSLNKKNWSLKINHTRNNSWYAIYLAVQLPNPCSSWLCGSLLSETRSEKTHNLYIVSVHFLQNSTRDTKTFSEASYRVHSFCVCLMLLVHGDLSSPLLSDHWKSVLFLQNGFAVVRPQAIMLRIHSHVSNQGLLATPSAHGSGGHLPHACLWSL